MTSRDFCYWLQGYFELQKPKELTSDQLLSIKKHLNLVFIHDIDVTESKESGIDRKTLNELHNFPTNTGSLGIKANC